MDSRPVSLQVGLCHSKSGREAWTSSSVQDIPEGMSVEEYADLLTVKIVVRECLHYRSGERAAKRSAQVRLVRDGAIHVVEDDDR